MKINDVVKILDAQVCCGEESLDREVTSAFASDMMSDVLAYLKDKAILITGLCNPQVIRTADMLEVECVVLVRGKIPTPDMLEIAKKRNIAVLSSKYIMFAACGKLYEYGLRAGAEKV